MKINILCFTSLLHNIWIVLSNFEIKNLKTLSLSTLLIVTLLIGCNNKKTIEKDLEDAARSGSLVSLSSSNSMSQLLCQNWENKEDIDDKILAVGNSELQIPFRSYCFYGDGSLVINPRDNIKFAKWVLNEKTKQIHIVFEDGSKKDFHINAIGVKSLLLQTDKNGIGKYVSDGRHHSNLSDDPFFAINNKWRIKPAFSEPDIDIKRRVTQAVIFYSKFLKDNADRGFKTISVYGLPTCFKWYSGGIGIVNKDKLSQGWINCFYNKNEAIKGQQILEKFISKKYKWDKSETQWIKQSADVLLQISDSLSAK